MNTPRNILIIRLSAIGDVVMASPLIKVLRRAYPQASVSWLVEPPAADLLRHNTDLDAVLVWPRNEWRRMWRQGHLLELWRAVRVFIHELRARRFDLVLDIQGLLKSAVWSWLSGARERIGLDCKEGSQRLMTRALHHVDDSDRIGSEYHWIARALNLDLGDFAMDIVLSDEDERYAGQLAQKNRYAVICPYTTRPQKHWAEERWLLLAETIAHSLNLAVLVLGGPDDIESAERIVKTSGCAVSLAGRCSLMQSAAVIKHADLVIGVDTGLTHMGIAFNRPTVALFGSTRPYLDTTRANARVIYHALECSPCRRNPTCDGRFDCMRDITVEEILATAQQVMTIK